MVSQENQRGIVSGVFLTAISVITIIGAIIGLTVAEQQLITGSQARVANADVRLVKNTISGTRIDDRTVRIFGDFCYTRYLQTGGAENWTIYPTNDRGQTLRAGSGSRHIDSGKVFVSAGGDFPAKCKTVNNDTGEAEWEVNNTDNMQPHSFSLELRLPQKLEGGYCPDVFLNYRGTWMGGTPFAKFNLSQIPGLCAPQATPTQAAQQPTTQPGAATIAPTVHVRIPTVTPTPANTITGTITVYGCQRPEKISLSYCNDPHCNERVALSTQSADNSTPTGTGIWLDDKNVDNTWVYRYSVDRYRGERLTSETTVRFRDAFAVYGGGSSSYRNTPELPDNLSVKSGGTLNFQIDAQATCGCMIKSVAYIKDAQGNPITQLDNNPLFGLANNAQITQSGDKPAGTFKNGQITVGPDEYTKLFNPSTYGPDTNAHVKLYAPGWKVLRQECTSRGSAPACPVYSTTSSKVAADLPRPNLFENLRVACGVDLEYGWILEQEPTPTPTPTPVVAQDLFSNIVCQMRDDSNASAPQNTGCQPTNLRGREDEGKQTVKEASVNLKWDAPRNCPAYREGYDRNMVVITRVDDGVVVATKRQMKDESTNVDPSNRDWNSVPGRKEVIRYFDKGVKYRAHVYAYLDKQPNCISKPSTFDFVGIGEDGDTDVHPETDEEDDDEGSSDPQLPGRGCEASRNEFCTGTGHGLGNAPDQGQQMCSASRAGSEWVGWCNNYNDSCCRASGGSNEPAGNSQPPSSGSQPPSSGSQQPPASNARCEGGWAPLDAIESSCVAPDFPTSDPGGSGLWCCSSNVRQGFAGPAGVAIDIYDLDNNGIINIADLTILMDQYGATTNISATQDQKSPDTNNDGIVNTLDYTALIQYLGTEVE